MEALIEQEEEARMTQMDEEYEYGRERLSDMEDAYVVAKEKMDASKKELDALKEEIVGMTSKGWTTTKVSVSEVTKKGSVDMVKLQRELNLMDYQIDAYRKKPVTYSVVKIKK